MLQSLLLQLYYVAIGGQEQSGGDGCQVWESQARGRKRGCRSAEERAGEGDILALASLKDQLGCALLPPSQQLSFNPSDVSRPPGVLKGLGRAALCSLSPSWAASSVLQPCRKFAGLTAGPATQNKMSLPTRLALCSAVSFFGRHSAKPAALVGGVNLTLARWEEPRLPERGLSPWICWRKCSRH